MGNTACMPAREADEADEASSEMSTTDVSGDTSSEVEGRSVLGSDCEATQFAMDDIDLSEILAHTQTAICVDELEDAINRFLDGHGTLSGEAIQTLDCAIGERSNERFYDGLLQTFQAEEFAESMMEALSSYGPSDWGMSHHQWLTQNEG